MNRYLITTADERSWEFDRPVVFLGEWCRLYDRKEVWGAMDAIVASPYGLDHGQKECDLAYVQSLSNRLLDELAVALNGFHNTRHKVRYWNIVLGHWLQRYVAVAFNRYFTLEQALKVHEVCGTTVFDSVEYSLATPDSLTFIWACSDDLWNNVFYARVLDYWGGITTELNPEPLREKTGFTLITTPNRTMKSTARRFISRAMSGVLARLSRDNDALIIDSCLPWKERIWLQLRLGQLPQLWRSPALKTVAYSAESRRHLTLDAADHHGFERFVRLLLREVIPTCYLEGYEQLIEQVDSLPWPSIPKFIFTSNAFDTNEIFKAWTGKKTEEGCSYFTGQHGSLYGTLLGSRNWPEFVTCDVFFTWGWTNGNLKNVPAFMFTTADRESGKWNADGGLLLIELHSPQRLDPEDSYYSFGTYQEEQFRFVEALPEKIKRALTVRLHRQWRMSSWSWQKRWSDRIPSACLELGTLPIQALIAKSRLAVYSYDSTGVLECLALNIPTLCFWHGGLDYLLPEARPFYELLNNAGILADSPEQAAAFVVLHWDNINAWWESQKVQVARKAFCDQYARIEKHPIRKMKRLLLKNANTEI